MGLVYKNKLTIQDLIPTAVFMVVSFAVVHDRNEKAFPSAVNFNFGHVLILCDLTKVYQYSNV